MSDNQARLRELSLLMPAIQYIQKWSNAKTAEYVTAIESAFKAESTVEKCRADAERYRFLVEELNYVGAFSLGKDNYLQVCGPGIGKVRKTIDVAIDAARQAAESAKGVE